jgi:MurNAc alpha-1-phosphate uridylyltransferase
VYRPDLFADKGPGRFALAPLLRDQMELGLVSGEVYSGFWMDIGTEERLEVVDRHFRAANALCDSVKKVPE